MPEIICKQRSEAWHRVRLGVFTASHADKVVRYNKRANKLELRDDTDAYWNYLYKLVAEKITGNPIEEKPSLSELPWIKRGIEKEDEARNAFIAKQGLMIKQVGFFTTADGRLGCSPDGMSLDNKQLIEIKVPAPWTFLQYKRRHIGPEAKNDPYEMQIAMQLIVTGAEAAHFFMWHEYWPHYYAKKTRDSNYIALIAPLLVQFADHVSSEHEECIKIGCLPPQTFDEAVSF